ncbi:MAG: DUF2309 domain-containing protein [Polyangiales bacterium]
MCHTDSTAEPRDDEARAVAALDHARHHLPDQGPIGTFIHHNTLHALEGLEFHEAMAFARSHLDVEVYLPLEKYREAWRTGRIDDADVDHALAARGTPDEAIGPFTARGIERLAIRHGVQAETPCGLRWALDERGDGAWTALWDVLCRVAPPPARAPHPLAQRVGRDRTHAELLATLGAPDPAGRVNAVLVPFLGAYLDEGISRWPMPGRDRGILACLRDHLAAAPALLSPWQREALALLQRDDAARRPPAARIAAALRALGVAPDDWPDYLTACLRALPGWTGMVSRLERHPHDRREGAPPASLAEVAAARLTLELPALTASARALGHDGPLGALVERLDDRAAGGDHDGPWRLLRLFELAGLGLDAARSFTADEAARALAVLDAFPADARRRALHDAYERHHLREIVGAVAANRARGRRAPDAPEMQVVVCIDDREESFRRHLEAFAPRAETFAVAGFFGVAMRFQALDDPNLSAQCPAVVQPGHTVVERAVAEDRPRSERRRRLRALQAALEHQLADGTRSFFRGALLTPLLGVFAAFPLAARVLFPRAAARAAEATRRALVPEATTELALASDGGFRLDEQVDRVATTLENIGLTRNFAPVVAFLGHGATTTNNPHHSAYDCGACGGRNGGPNARAFAQMANNPAVREALRARGVDIPAATWFVGGLHDTTSDAVALFDLERAPKESADALARLRRALDHARTMSAHERCRRFEHADDDLSPAAALAHVEERSVDLSQARPELGHATNAACVVGRRALTRGLFLDRRAFLVSYDPTTDKNGAVLERLLRAVVPVGAGINLEYYFSTVDPERLGAGTKLPHNVASLLGVMEGASGDLRTGLPRQMTEIHEPVRLLCVIEATPETLLAVAGRAEEVGRLVGNGWVRLVSCNPETGALLALTPKGFEPIADPLAPAAAPEMTWYQGHLDHLPAALLPPEPA